MTRLQPLVIAAVITILVIAFAVFDGDAGRSEPGPAPAPWPGRYEVANAQAYADWCGGFMQVSLRTHEVSVEGCDR